MRIRHHLLLLFYLSISDLSFSQNLDSIGTINKHEVRAITANGNKLYVGMDNLSDPGPCKIKVWDGSQWDSLCCATPIKMIFHNNELYGCAGSLIGVAKFDGVSWHTIGQLPASGAVFDIHFYNNELYAAGGFDSIGGVKASCIARWDGTTWHAIDTTDFDDGLIYSAIHYNGELYIGGVFQNWNATVGLVSKWNGSTWEIPGGNIYNLPLGSTIEYMEVFNNELYLGGYIFPNGNNLHDIGIVRWDGTNWKDVGGGINGPGTPRVNRMIAYDNKLFVAGYFNTAGNIPANAIAIWNGTEWCGLGSVINGQILDFTFYDSTLIIGGDFLTIDNDSLNYLAQWIGGTYEDTCSTPDGINESELVPEINCFPNPASGLVTVKINSRRKGKVTFQVFNALGERVIESKENFDGSEFTFDVSSLPSSIYFLQVHLTNGIIASRKIIKI